MEFAKLPKNAGDLEESADCAHQRDARIELFQS